MQSKLLQRGKSQYGSPVPSSTSQRQQFVPDLKVSELYGSVVKVDAPDGFPYVTNSNQIPNGHDRSKYTLSGGTSFVQGVDFSCQVWSRQNYPFWQYNRRNQLTQSDPNVADGPGNNRLSHQHMSRRLPEVLDGPGSLKGESRLK